MSSETDTKRRAKYLAKAITRNDKAATAVLESEFPGETKRVEGYRAAYYDHLHPDHQRVVDMVGELYTAAGDWLEF